MKINIHSIPKDQKNISFFPIICSVTTKMSYLNNIRTESLIRSATKEQQILTTLPHKKSKTLSYVPETIQGRLEVKVISVASIV